MNYGQLRTQFIGILNRDDCTTALADTFLSQGIAAVQRVLRLRLMEKEVSLSVDANGYASIPADFLQMNEGIWWNESKKLVHKPFSDFLTYGIPGIPALYTRRGQKWQVKPNPGVDTTNFKISYFAAFGRLTEPTDTDPILSKAADAILYRSLVFGADYFVHDMKDAWGASASQAISELQQEDIEANMAESTLLVSSGRDEDY